MMKSQLEKIKKKEHNVISEMFHSFLEISLQFQIHLDSAVSSEIP